MDHQEWEQRKRKLQQKAERVLKSSSLERCSEDLERDNYNLRVHQIELEIQNEELRAAQLQIEKERTRYANLYHFSPLGFVVLDKAAIIVEANHRFCSMLGYPVTSILRKPLNSFISPEDQDIFLGRYAPFFKSPSGKNIEIRLLTSRKESIFARLSGCMQREDKLFYDGEKDISLLLVAVDDITTQKQAEEALENAYQLTSLTIDALSASICVLDGTGKIVAVNKSWREFERAHSGRTIDWKGIDYLQICEEATGKDAEFSWKFADGLRTVIQGFAEYFELEYPCSLEDGLHWFVGRVTPLEGKQDCPRRHVVVAHEDITVRKNSEALLHDFNRKLQEQIDLELEKVEQLQREKELQQMALIQQTKMAELGGMIGAIAHQWKQPLNSINLLNECLRDAFEYGEIDQTMMNEHISEVQNLVTFMATTIDDFRDFYLPCKETSRFAVKPVVESVARLLKWQLMKYSVELTITGDDELHVTGRPSELKQVILNILNNAKDILSEKQGDERIIQVEIFEKDNSAVIAIRDNGGGIPEPLLDGKIFEPFFSTKGEKGTGIGLSLSKLIIEKNMCGSLQAVNRDGGAEFSIILPRS